MVKFLVDFRAVFWVILISGILADTVTSEASENLVNSASSPSASSNEDELVIYTYDSFVAHGGLGPEILPLFEKKYHCHVKALSAGNGGQLLTRLELDAKRGKSVAHLMVGIDQHVLKMAQPWVESWGNWVPSGVEHFVPALDSMLSSKPLLNSLPNSLPKSSSKLTRNFRGFLPYDYGVLSFIGDREALREMKLPPPKSLSDLLKPNWRKNIILEDPRTSTPGLSFFLYTNTLLGKSVWNFWNEFKQQWLTLTPGWDGAYGLFLKKEAPLVWSYLTSQAYHEEHGDAIGAKRRFEAVLFEEGQPFQVEGAAWVKGSLKTERQKKLARNFLEFLISPEVQKLIPQKIWMFPARKDVELPESFKRLPQSSHLISSSEDAHQIESSLAKWAQVVGQ